MYSALKTCKNGDNCPFAHGHRELDVEYKPVEWVKIFRQSSTQHFRRETYVNRNLPEISDVSGLQSMSPASIRPMTTTQGSRENNINRVINTVFLA